MKHIEDCPVLQNIVLVLLALVFVYVIASIPVHLHGYYRDHFVGSLDDDCWMCDFYRFWQRHDTAFQIRELNRKGSK